MRWYPRVVLLTFVITVGSQREHSFTYHGTSQDTYHTLEGTNVSPELVKERSKRFLSFNNDKSNIRVEMVFAIPVLAIPIGGKDMSDSPGGQVSPVVDVNAKSLIVASVLLFMLFLVIPKLVRVFIPATPEGRGVVESEIDRIIRGVESTFHVNTTSCWQQGVCYLVQTSRQDMTSGNPSSWEKVIEGISNMQWVDRLTEGTSLGEAIASAKNDDDRCREFYSQCPLSFEKLSKFSRELVRRYMNHLIQQYNSNTKV